MPTLIGPVPGAIELSRDEATVPAGNWAWGYRSPLRGVCARGDCQSQPVCAARGERDGLCGDMRARDPMLRRGVFTLEQKTLVQRDLSTRQPSSGDALHAESTRERLRPYSYA